MVGILVHRATARENLLHLAPSLSTQILHPFFPSQLSTNTFRHDVDPGAEAGLIDWDAIDSDHSNEQDRAVEAGRATRAPAEKKLRVPRSEDLR